MCRYSRPFPGKRFTITAPVSMIPSARYVLEEYVASKVWKVVSRVGQLWLSPRRFNNVNSPGTAILSGSARGCLANIVHTDRGGVGPGVANLHLEFLPLLDSWQVASPRATIAPLILQTSDSPAQPALDTARGMLRWNSRQGGGCFRKGTSSAAVKMFTC